MNQDGFGVPNMELFDLLNVIIWLTCEKYSVEEWVSLSGVPGATSKGPTWGFVRNADLGPSHACLPSSPGDAPASARRW